MKKGAKRAIAAGILVAAGVIGGVYLKANASVNVMSHTVSKTKLTKITELNSNIESNSSKTYYATIDSKIGQVLVKEGDIVKKGDLLISYDNDDIDRQLAKIDLDVKTGQGDYDDALSMNRRYNGLYSEATKNLEVLNQQIADTEAALTLAQNKLLEGNYGDYAKAQEEVNRLSAALADYKEYKAEMTSQKASSYPSLMTKAGKEKLEAVREANDILYAERSEKLTEAKEGIRAAYNGVITVISVNEGANVAEGTQLVTLRSLEDIVVKSDVNKYDIDLIKIGQPATVKIRGTEFSGKVTRIEGMTDEVKGTGVGVDITLDKPDDSIILGLEVKSYVRTAELDDVLTVPAESFFSDAGGDYVYVLRDKKAVRVFVEAGIQNDDMIEICSGLSEGDIVVWSNASELKDGTEVCVE